MILGEISRKVFDVIFIYKPYKFPTMQLLVTKIDTAMLYKNKDEMAPCVFHLDTRMRATPIERCFLWRDKYMVKGRR